MPPPRIRRKHKDELARRHTFLAISAAVFSILTIQRIVNLARPQRSPTSPISPAMMLDQFKSSSTFNKPQVSKNRAILPEVYDFTGTGNLHRNGEVRLETKQSPIGGAFVHVGKTGGSALSVLLRNGCHSFIPHPCRTITNETIASKLINSYYHVPDFNFLPQSHHDFYLMTLRDPFDRTVSAFTFEHIDNKRARGEGIEPVKIRKLEYAYTCFRSLEEYVSYLEGNATDFNYPHHSTKIRKPCRDLARAALFGLVRPFNHFFFNLHHVFLLMILFLCILLLLATKFLLY